ncbi:MAG: peptidylprolyl isomerase [Verrucomicrobia bacterium]|nr:peptidylprolyl isomerase [Verrucomicrobiota bacterium]
MAIVFKLRVSFVICLWLAGIVTARAQQQEPGLYAEIVIAERGTLRARLDCEHAPLAVTNFVGLAEGTLPNAARPTGAPFFDGLTFHRGVKDFVVQAGDPGSADPATPADKLGEGGPGYSFPDEFGPACGRHDAAGVLSMANDGPDTNGSQWFITLRDTPRLNYLHSVFGHVVSGLEILPTIAQGDRIERVRIVRVGAAAEAFRADGAAFDLLKKNVLAARLSAAPAGFVYFADETQALPDFRVKNFNAKLANYERATGHRLALRVRDAEAAANEAAARAATKATAAALGLADDGDNALVCYFPGPEIWKARLGEKLFPALLGHEGSAADLMRARVMHQGKEALLAEAQALTKAGKLKEAIDAALDTLMLKLDDAARATGADVYQNTAPSADGIGKVYLGREIAQVMGHEGADWLDRPTREQEERTDLLMDELRQRLADKPDAVVADIGAGSGYFSMRLSLLVPQGKVLAEDIDPEMLKIIARRTQRRRATGAVKFPNIETVLGTTTDPRLPEKGVDLVLLVDAYHEFDHPREMMQAIVRALKPGGQVMQLEYRAEDPDVPIKPHHKMTAAQARKEMEAVGLVWKETKDNLPQQHLLVFEKPR